MSVAVLEHRTSQRLLLACWLAVLARVILVVGLITTPVAIISYEIWELLYVLTLGIFLLVMGAYKEQALMDQRTWAALLGRESRGAGPEGHASTVHVTAR